MIDTLYTTVGFELEFIPPACGVDQVYRELQRNSVPVDFQTRWRRTPSTTSSTGVWDLKPDSSCGYELVSPIISTMRQLKDAANVARLVSLAGGTVNERCGFHIHLGIVNLTGDALDRLFRFLSRYEEAFFMLVGDNRRRNPYCKPWSKPQIDKLRRYSGQLTAAWPDRGVVAASADVWSDKNVFINGRTISRIGTLEARLFEGTLDPDTILNAIIFMQQVMGSVIHGKKAIQWGRAAARDSKMLFMTMLQQAGCYGKSMQDEDLAKSARKWAVKRMRQFAHCESVMDNGAHEVESGSDDFQTVISSTTTTTPSTSDWVRSEAAAHLERVLDTRGTTNTATTSRIIFT